MYATILQLQHLFNDKFFTDVWDQKYCYFPQAISNPEKLFNWQELNRLVEFHVREYPRWALAKNKKYIPLKEFSIQEKSTEAYVRVDFLKIRELIKEGATLIFNNAELSTPSLRVTCQTLFSVFREDVFVNAYASFGTDPGFGLHYDDMDTLILQIAGRKHWSLYGRLKSTAPPRNKRAVFFKHPPTKKRFELQLQAGDFLYLPAGYWHDVVSLNGPSLHLTFSVYNRTGADFLQSLVEKFSSDERLLSAISKNLSVHDKKAFAERIRKLLVPSLSASGLDHFFEHHDKRPPFFAPLGLPFSVLQDPFENTPLQETDVLSFICSSWSEFAKLPGTNQITFSALGKRWTFEKKYQPLLSLFFCRISMTVSDLLHTHPELSTQETYDFIKQAVQEGLLTREVR